MVRDRAFIFHIDVPLGKTLSLVLKSRSSVKVRYQGHSFRKKMAVAGALDFHRAWVKDVNIFPNDKI